MKKRTIIRNKEFDKEEQIQQSRESKMRKESVSERQMERK